MFFQNEEFIHIMRSNFASAAALHGYNLCSILQGRQKNELGVSIVDAIFEIPE